MPASRVAILSCGPSLAAYPGPDRYAQRIAVNHAIEKHAADWWCFADDWMTRRTPAEPHPHGLWISAESLYRNERRKDPRLEWMRNRRIWLWQNVELDGLSSNKWRVFSVTSALVLAYLLGARFVDVYGHDMVGEEDFCGESTGQGVRRDAERWSTERRIWGEVVRYVQGHGVLVKRVTE